MSIESFTLIFTALLAFATVGLAIATWSLAKSSWKMANETRDSSILQLGMQSWLQMVSRFDSSEIRKARSKLAEQLENYTPEKHDEVIEVVLDVFEDIGTLYIKQMINKDMAYSSFSYYAIRWWEVAKEYICQERERNKDKEIFCDFEKFAKDMRAQSQEIESIDLRKFINDEKHLKLA